MIPSPRVKKERRRVERTDSSYWLCVLCYQILEDNLVELHSPVMLFNADG